MSVINFPAELRAAKMSWGQHRNDMEFRSPFSSQSLELSHPAWEVSLEPPPRTEETAGAWQALLLRLRGRTHQLALWNTARPYPRGTMRGTMLVHAPAAMGADTLSVVASGQGHQTLLRGDMLGIGSGITQQVVIVVADAVADAAGIISVSIESPLRNAFASGAAVTWDRPKALFRRRTGGTKWDYSRGLLSSGYTLDLIEDWRP